jgi:hypothetical protein
MKQFARCAGALVLTIAAQGAHSQARLEWNVVNRFPILSTAGFEEIESAWRAASKRTMWDFINARLRAKASGNLTRMDFLLIDPAKASSAPNAAIGDLVTVRLDAGVRDVSCRWTVSPSPFISPVEAQCDTVMTIRRGQPTEVSVSSSEGTSRAMVDVQDVVVAAMGDSYASGEGSPDRPAIYAPGARTPPRNDWFKSTSFQPQQAAVWLDPVCHRSLLSWPVLATLRLALEHPKAVVRLVDVSCSGAEFLDGFFISQEKTPIDETRKNLTTFRDGIGKRNTKPVEENSLYLPRSQVNALRDALCSDWPAGTEDVGFSDAPFAATWRSCASPRMRPDALLLTAGGNDVRFGPAVKGVLIPNVPRSVLLAPIALKEMRRIADATRPEDLTRRAEVFAKVYAEYLGAAARGAMVDPKRTVLVTYPNPVGPAGVDCRDFRGRIQTSFLSFGPLVREAVPQLFRRRVNWVVELSKDEVREFTTRAYPAVRAMQRTGTSEFVLVDWHPTAGGQPDDGRSFANRLLCTGESQPEAKGKQDALEPIFFCNRNECQTSPYTRRESLDAWQFEAAGRREVNTTNDALLGQRTWVKGSPTLNDLAVTLSGTFHPVTESHAVAADSAYDGLCRVLDPSRGFCAPRR